VRRLNMGEIRKISQDHSDIGMRNDAAPSIDQEGDTVIADPLSQLPCLGSP